jgi:serine/threonine protein kinase
MGQPTKTDTNVSLGDETRSVADSQATIRLSNFVSADASIPGADAPTFSGTNFSTAGLTALSQRYDIIGEAGRGNMGYVYKARDRETGETVALKLIKPEIASDQAMMERFKNELLYARKITHKNVCRVYDFNRIGGTAYTSMEFVEGESLRSVLNRFGGLPQRKAIDIAQHICSGLKEAHAQGIVHRDLKPENVMIDANGNVKILDFGIARSMEAGTRITGSMVGTPAYMAPEQVAGKPADYRTDIYSLGLILYEMFTGTPAFQADTPVAVALKQIRETPVPPHEIDFSIPVSIERVILKCLEKEPAKRYQSIAEVENSFRSLPGAGKGNGAAAAVTPTPTPLRTTEIATSFPAPSSQFKKKSRRSSFWLTLGFLFFVLGTLSALRAMSIVKAARRIPTPASMPAPRPPALAFEKQPILPSAAHAALTSAKSGAHAKLGRSDVFPRVEFGKPQVHSRPANAAPAALQNLGRYTPYYILLGRFERENSAQDIADRAQKLGLPVFLMPRRSRLGRFFTVFTGPFGAEKAEEEMKRLRDAGLYDVRAVHGPLGNPNWHP